MTTFSIYTRDDDGSEWYFTGKGWSENPENGMMYSTDKPLDFIKKNITDFPAIKKLLSKREAGTKVFLSAWGYADIEI